MINALLSVWILIEAIRRRCHRLIPVSVLVLLYEGADVGWIRVSELISMEGTIKKMILFLLVLFVFLAWRKKQVKLSAMAACGLALGGRLAWGPVFDRYLEALQQPDANYVGLVAQGAAVKILFGAATDAMLIVMLVLILVTVRKVPLESNC